MICVGTFFIQKLYVTLSNDVVYVKINISTQCLESGIMVLSMKTCSTNTIFLNDRGAWIERLLLDNNRWFGGR